MRRRGGANSRRLPPERLTSSRWWRAAIGVSAHQTAVNTVIGSRGAVIAVSTTGRLAGATSARRRRAVGDLSIRVFDPDGVTGRQRDTWWNPLTGINTEAGAARFVGHFLRHLPGPAGAGQPDALAGRLLAALVLAAATNGGSLRDVLTWVDHLHAVSPEVPPLPPAAREHVDRLRGDHAAPAAWDSAVEVAGLALRCLRDPRVADWVCPPPGYDPWDDLLGREPRGQRPDDPDLSPFWVSKVVSGSFTLHILSTGTFHSALPLAAALLDCCLSQAVAVAEAVKGINWWPVTVVLHDADAVSRLVDLVDHLPHLHGRAFRLIETSRPPTL